MNLYRLGECKPNLKFVMEEAWGPLDPKIWGGWGGGIDKKSDLSLQKSKKSIFFPKSGGAAAPTAPPAADPMGGSA